MTGPADRVRVRRWLVTRLPRRHARRHRGRVRLLHVGCGRTPAGPTGRLHHRQRLAEARQALLADVADSDALLFAAHFPKSIPGRVLSSPGGGYSFAPVPGSVVDGP